MATYNGAKFIREQLDSILVQLAPEDEIIVSDDGSTDGTLDIISSYQDPRIKVLRHAKDPRLKRTPEIVGANFQHALVHATGDYIFISDQDDIWLPGKVDKMSACLSEAALAACNARALVDGEEKGLIYRDKLPMKNYTLRRGKYYGCCMAFTREVLQYALPFPHKMPLYDYWIGLIAEVVGGVQYIPEPLALHRIHSSNTSRTLKLPVYYKVYYRIRLLVQIYARLLTIKLKNK